MLKSVVFMVFYSFVYSKADNIRIDVDVKKLGWNKDTLRQWTYIDKEYDVTLFQPFDIYFKNAGAQRIECVSHYNSCDSFSKMSNEKEQNDIHLEIYNATNKMDDMWKCSLTKDVEFRDIYFKIRVKGAKPPQMILVNSVILPIEKVSDIYSTKYIYKEGDNVDVACINPDNYECKVQLRYNYNKDVEYEEVSSNTRVGFKTKLQTKHNSSEMTCTYNCPGKPVASVLVQFLLTKEVKDIMELQINDKPVRGTQNTCFNVNYTIFNYAIFENTLKTLNLQCETSEKGVYLTPNCYDCGGVPEPNRIINTYEISDNTNIFKISYSASNSSTKNTLQNMEIGFTKLSQKINVKLPLSFAVRTNDQVNVFYDILFYENRSTQLIYYEYEKDDILKVTCKYHGSSNTSRLNFYGKDKKANEDGLIILIETVSASDLLLTNNTAECVLEDSGNIASQIRSYFRVKPSPIMPPTTTSTSTTTVTTTTTSTTVTSTTTSTSTALTSSTELSPTSSIPDILHISSTTGNPKADLVIPEEKGRNIWIIGLALIVIVAMIGVSVIIYRKKKPNCLSKVESESNENFNPNDDTIIPQYPSQWETSEYAVPDCREKKASLRRDDCYAVPVPKSFRKTSKAISISKERNSFKPESDGFYASPNDALHDNLGIDTYAEPTGTIHNDKEAYVNSSNVEPKDIYAQVQSSRKNSNGTGAYANNTELNQRKKSAGTYANASNLTNTYAEVPTVLKNDKETYANAANLPPKDIYAEIQPTSKNNVDTYRNSSQFPSEYAYAELPSSAKNDQKAYANTIKVDPKDIYAEPTTNIIKDSYTNTSESPYAYAYAEIPTPIKINKDTCANTTDIDIKDIYANDKAYANTSKDPKEAFAESTNNIKETPNTPNIDSLDTYAEVQPLIKDKNYGNASGYSNIENNSNTEYVQPTYCDPTNLK